MAAITNVTSSPVNGAVLAYVGFAVGPHDGTLYTDFATAWAAHDYLGAVEKASANITLPGEPARDTIQAAVDGGVEFLAAYTASTDPATFEATWLEAQLRDVWENFAGVDFGANTYGYSDGGLPDFVSAVAVGLDAEKNPVIGWHLPYAMPSTSGSIAHQVGGADSVLQVPGKFSGSTDPISGQKFGLFLPESTAGY